MRGFFNIYGFIIIAVIMIPNIVFAIKNKNGFSAMSVKLIGVNQQQSHIAAATLRPEMQFAASGVERLKAVWSGFGAEQAPAVSSVAAN